MSPLEIVVRGNASGRYAPELAVVGLAVRAEDNDKATVRSAAAAAHASLTEALASLEADGAVTTWSSDAVRVYSHRPYDPSGKRRELLYTTRIGVEATFVDFEKLSEFVDRWIGADDVEVSRVSWAVTEENRRAFERDLRRLAVDDAVDKAQAYADAVGRGPVVATQLADPNMLAEPRPMPMMRAAAPMGDTGPSIELRPEDIEIVVAVDARFAAD
ncbi:SIMPL domain-containing protein [Gordonia sp. NPDC003585]|uniref:SIMPL domain-containing protein n=1 Tax=Gordonia sp. NPDC003585 TaxID=3154275 RepID=UPI0033A8D719